MGQVKFPFNREYYKRRNLKEIDEGNIFQSDISKGVLCESS